MGRLGDVTPGLPIITLLTDFGVADYFVGAVKGAILSRNRAVTLVDISHDVPAHDVESAAFTLLAVYKSFPRGTINLVVVDPGVGSERRPIVVQAAGQLFVGPDNGIFSYVYESDPAAKVFEITNQKYFVESPSPTFHGRDLFGPVAAMLSLGVQVETVGPAVAEPVRLRPLAPEVYPDGSIKGRVIQIDRFGNCITNIRRNDVESPAKVIVKKQTISDFRNYFAEKKRSGPFAIWGSAGFLELAVLNGSAAKLLNLSTGAEVRVVSS